MSRMTQQQRVAMAHPCYLAEETAHPRFGRRARDGKATILLTINAGYE